MAEFRPQNCLKRNTGFNVRGEHVPGCLGRGWGRGLGGFYNVLNMGRSPVFRVFGPIWRFHSQI